LRMRVVIIVYGLALALALTACNGAAGEADTDSSTPPAVTTPAVTATATPATTAVADEQRYPDIVDAELTRNDDGTYDIAVTVSSPYDSPERYADAWRVLSPDDRVLAERELLHDHANEQPFTRSLTNVTIPADVTEVTIQGRDLRYGYGGETVTVPVPGR
jgi:protein-disulfide isomerase